MLVEMDEIVQLQLVGIAILIFSMYPTLFGLYLLELL